MELPRRVVPPPRVLETFSRFPGAYIGSYKGRMPGGDIVGTPLGV